MKVRLVAILGALLFAMSAQAGQLTDFHGKNRAISDFTGDGKWRIVMIWASDCHVCNDEAHEYVKFHENHQAVDAQMLGISLDGKDKFSEAREFVKRHGISFPNLIGEPEEVVVEYMKLTGSEWIGTPTFLIYTPKGKLVAKQEGAVPVKLIENFIASSSAAN